MWRRCALGTVECIQQKVATAKAEAKERHRRHVDELERFVTTQKESFKQLFAKESFK